MTKGVSIKHLSKIIFLDILSALFTTWASSLSNTNGIVSATAVFTHVTYTAFKPFFDKPRNANSFLRSDTFILLQFWVFLFQQCFHWQNPNSYISTEEDAHLCNYCSPLQYLSTKMDLAAYHYHILPPLSLHLAFFTSNMVVLEINVYQMLRTALGDTGNCTNFPYLKFLIQTYV